MIKIYKNTKKKTTTAVFTNSEFDAVRHIDKCMESGLDLASAVMQSNYSGTVNVHAEDTYDERQGELEALAKASKNYDRAYRKAMKRWQVYALRKIREVYPETFEEAVHEVVHCKCDK